MKHTKKIICTGAIAAIMFSTGSIAATRTDGLNACASAAVAEISISQDAAPNFSLTPESSISRAKLNRRELFHLDLRNPSTDEVLARVDCTVDQRARVIDLKEVPLEGKDAVARSES